MENWWCGLDSLQRTMTHAVTSCWHPLLRERTCTRLVATEYNHNQQLVRQCQWVLPQCTSPRSVHIVLLHSGVTRGALGLPHSKLVCISYSFHSCHACLVFLDLITFNTWFNCTSQSNNQHCYFAFGWSKFQIWVRRLHWFSFSWYSSVPTAKYWASVSSPFYHTPSHSPFFYAIFWATGSVVKQ